jgi:3',5'-cyclic AMP phosphodiesterase CpdA
VGVAGVHQPTNHPEEARLWAISDLHVGYPDNHALVAALQPESPHDWLLVAGDVAENFADIQWALELLASRYAKVVWAPGNHELWTPSGDPVQLRGEARYQRLVQLCRSLGVLTPEDPYPVFHGRGGPVQVAALLLLYDYTFRPDGATNKQEALAAAFNAGIVCTDELLLHPDPYPSREAWCAQRLTVTQARLDGLDPALPVVLVNHYPLVREPTAVLRYPQFAQWCGTVETADWHRRWRTAAVVYGHLHIRRTTWYDAVPFLEVSVGYPHEWSRRSGAATTPVLVLPGS